MQVAKYILHFWNQTLFDRKGDVAQVGNEEINKTLCLINHRLRKYLG